MRNWLMKSKQVHNFALNSNIQFVIERKGLLHLDTIKARNYLLTLEDME